MKNKKLKVETNIRATQMIRTLDKIGLPARIIDIEKNIITICEDWDFWTLSYVWKTLKEDEKWSIGNRPYPNNNKLWYVNAFDENDWEKTRKLLTENDIKKVWVDSLCIDQESDIEKGLEISKMANIYKNSIGCIIFPDGLCEKSDILDFKYKRNKWFSRVWTLQEGILPKELKAYIEYDKFDDVKKIFDKWNIDNNKYEYQNVIAETGIEKIAPYELLRIISHRNATKLEDKVYSLISILGLKEIELKYEIGERNAAINVFQAMNIDQRAQWICVDWISDDKMSCIPLLKFKKYNNIDINVTSNIKIKTILAGVEFYNDKTVVNGECFEANVVDNFEIKESKIIPSRIKLDEIICYGVCNYTGKVICIILGTTDKSNKGEKVILICKKINNNLIKCGLVRTKHEIQTKNINLSIM